MRLRALLVAASLLTLASSAAADESEDIYDDPLNLDEQLPHESPPARPTPLARTVPYRVEEGPNEKAAIAGAAVFGGCYLVTVAGAAQAQHFPAVMLIPVAGPIIPALQLP